MDFRSLIGIIVLVIVLWLALDLLLAGGSMTGGMMGGMAGMMGSGSRNDGIGHRAYRHFLTATNYCLADLRKTLKNRNNLMQIDMKSTELTRTRYQRIAPVYDRMEGTAERRIHPLRPRLWSLVRGPKVLEVGVGTGKNIPFYPNGMAITAIDLTPGMLERAQRRAQALQRVVDLRLGDVQALAFPDNSFDDAVATCVFCSVPDPLLGLQEVVRVVKPGGQVLLLEHMRSANPLLGLLMDVLNPMVVRMMGANINRRTLENVQRSGLQLEHVEDVGMGGIFKLIVARNLKT